MRRSSSLFFFFFLCDRWATPATRSSARKCHEIFHKVNQPCNDGNRGLPSQQGHSEQEPPSADQDPNGPQRSTAVYRGVYLSDLGAERQKISRFIEVSRDITDRKREEEEITRRLEQMVEDRTRQLEETHAKLLHQDKMASLGKLSASVVHEINNPIAGILNLIMLIKRIMEEGPLSQHELDKFSQYPQPYGHGNPPDQPNCIQSLGLLLRVHAGLKRCGYQTG